MELKTPQTLFAWKLIRVYADPAVAEAYWAGKAVAEWRHLPPLRGN